MKIINFLCALILLNLSFTVNADCKFDKTVSYDNYQIRIFTDGNSCSLQTYQIVVQSGGQILKAATEQGEPIQQTWIKDLDRDGLFEVLVFSASMEEGEYGELALYEWNGIDFEAHFLPALNAAQQQGYRGFDKYRMYQDQLIHEFPVYQQGDKDCCASGGRRQSVYQYQNNSFKQIFSNIVN